MNRRSVLLLPALLCCSIFSPAQTANPPQPTSRTTPPDYRGPQTYIPGVFVTPIPNAPFAADVEVISHQMLPDGTENVRTTTINHIARDSSGRIYNERRALVPILVKGAPRLLSAHIFNPADRMSIFYDPATRVARETILPPFVAARQMPTRPPVPSINNPWAALAPGNALAQALPGRSTNPAATVPAQPQLKEIDLGEQTIDGTNLHGTEKQLTIAADFSGTGKPLIITTEYWYSPDLYVYLIVKHNDPRTGEQIVAVTHIDRAEPPATQFRVPDIYKVVDETPPPLLPVPAASR